MYNISLPPGLVAKILLWFDKDTQKGIWMSTRDYYEVLGVVGMPALMK